MIRRSKSSSGIRKRSLYVLVILMIVCMISGGIIYASSARNSGAARGTEGALLTTDPSSMDGWTGIAQSNTKFIGRIWTDKSVLQNDLTLSPNPITIEKENSDFMVALSALSSTSNITSLTGGQPLDIVMVLDTSGSMGYDFDTVFEPTYDTTVVFRESRYVQVDGEYVELDRVRGDGWSYYWALNGQRIEFKTDASDANLAHYQMYEYREVTRMESLKEAANDFIDETAKVNESITDADDRHRISIVSYASSSDIKAPLQECSGNNQTRLKEAVSNLRANGSTGADYGMESAGDVLESARPAAKKVVIFFTDGEPNHGNGFDSTVANDAISTAKTLKDEGALIYTIGIFEGANVDGTDESNSYMNGMSSNYPAATSYTNLGERVNETAAYYKVADNAGALKNIFTEISKEIVSSAGYPTKIENPSGDPMDGTDDGYITFTDRLGDYMKVDDFKAIVFANTKFELPTGGKTTDGLVDTYTFKGTAGNSIYPDGNLDTIEIKVQRSADEKTGDLVTVKIPAAMIPLRDFNVNSEDPDNPETTVNDAYPIRIFYGVSLKDGVKDSLARPDSELAQYIKENSKDGKVSFYSNAFTKGAELGETTAVFTPAESNSYYYFTEDSYLFSDERCSEPITRLEGRPAGYYYQRSFYTVGADTAEKYAIDIKGSGLEELLKSAKVGENGQYYIPAGTPRLTTVTDMHTVKKTNDTSTAGDVADQKWNDMGVNTAEDIIAYLGNNGRMDLDLPGTLKVSKDIAVADGFDKSAYLDTEFEFTLELTGADGQYDAEIFDENGNRQGSEFTVENGGTFKLKAGESIYVYGLPHGAEYAVDEQNIPAGFSKTSATANEGNIVGGEEQSAEFLNTYDAELPDTVDTADFFKGAKILDGRDWNQGDSFLMVIETESGVPTEKAQTKLTADTDGQYKDGDKVPFDFGKAQFTKPGTYVYEIYESEMGAGPKLPGVSYSQAAYTVTVTVTDNGDGTLGAVSAMVQNTDDYGVKTEVNVTEALITNRYDADSQLEGPIGDKIYDDLSGGDMPLDKCEFSFRVTPLTAGAPQPEGMSPEADGSFVVGHVGTSISYGKAEFTAAHAAAGNSYDYLLEEVIPDGAVDNTYKGMTYDDAKYIARFTPAVVGSGADAVVQVEVTYWNTEDGQTATTQVQADRISFSNSYKPEAVVLTGDTAIGGEKTFNGRDMKGGEAFSFNLEAADDATAAAMTAGDVSVGNAKAQVTGAKNGKAEEFFFGDVTFKKSGTYKFKITEEAGDAKGVTYDAHATEVTVTVRDDEGKLQASVAYDNKGAAEATDKAVFVNTYKASLDYGAAGGLTVTKTLNGRALNKDEFDFTITAQGDAPIAAADKSFKNVKGEEGKAVSMAKLKSLKFTEADVGKTYVYIVDEAEKPAAEAKGITYDKAEYKVEITVTDPAQEGTLTAETKVTRIKASDGTEVEEAVGTYSTADGTSPQVDFVNSYKAASVEVDTTGFFNKTLLGREWLDSDEFNFKIEAVNPADGPMPENTTAEATKPGSGATASFGFGKITFDEAGKYEYVITEEAGAIPGINYTKTTAKMTVTVTDNGDGTMSVSRVIVGKEFINEYDATMDYGAVGGLDITKTLTGKDMEAGKFEFIVKGADEASREKLGIGADGEKHYNPAAADGAKATVVSLGNEFKFDSSDDGKTYTYEISETDKKESGYTYDTAVRTVEISVEDLLNGKLKVTTVVKGDGEEDETYTYVTGENPQSRATVDFTNEYEASTGDDGFAVLGAYKELTGRPLKDKEFTFEVKTKDDSPETVMTGTNDADGNITFDKKFEYTGASLDKAVRYGYASRAKVDGSYVWTVNYTVFEDTLDFADKGLTGTVASHDFTVTVTDDGAGKLKATVNYPAGEDKFTFENTYSTGAPVSLTIKGSKILKAEAGLLPPDIEGKYDFTITGEDNAPMPANSKASNDKDGNVNFGEVTFDLSMLEGVAVADDGSRTREFKYKVTESGTLPGISNDGDKEFVVTLKDDGKGRLTAAWGAGGAAFTFTNEYKIVEPKISSVTDVIEITKKLDGADISKYEFSFELLEGDEVVATGKSNADGRVVFEGIEYTKPGTHHYIVSEVDGGIKGVTYDKSRFEITTEVKDNGDGTLTVEHSLPENQGDGITFENKYAITEGVSVVIGASKVLTGSELAKDQFSFELVDENGKVLDVAKNDEKGTVTFKEIEYDAAGIYKYTVREVNDGQENITYDDKTYQVTVDVKDVDSVLEASTECDDMVFTNIFTGEADKGDDNAPKTGDGSDMAPWLLLTAASMAALAALVRKESRK